MKSTKEMTIGMLEADIEDLKHQMDFHKRIRDEYAKKIEDHFAGKKELDDVNFTIQLCGRDREEAKVDMLDQMISFLTGNIKAVKEYWE